MNIPLSPCVPENLVSRDGFSRPVPRQPAHLHTQAESNECLWMMPSISPLITCKTLHCCAPSVTSTQNKRQSTDRRPRNWWSFILCIRNRNDTQELDSETRDRRTRAESDKQEQKTRVENKSDSEGTIRERNNPRKNNPKMANSTRVQ